MNIDEFEDAYYDTLSAVGLKLLEWFPDLNGDEYLYASILAKYIDPNYTETIRGVWDPELQKKILQAAFQALIQLQDNIHPDVAHVINLHLERDKPGAQIPFGHGLARAFEAGELYIKMGQKKRSSFNTRAVAILETCVDAWEYLGEQRAPNTINDGSPIIRFIQEIFDILNETSSVVSAHRALKNTQ